MFRTALDSAKKDPALENRLRNMIETIMRQIYDYTCTGIFERHKLMFSFQMTCMIMNGEGTLDMSVLDFFLKGDTSLEGVSEACPVAWLAGSGWKDLVCFSGLSAACAELLKEFKSDTSVWKDWYDLETPETVPMPCGFSEKVLYCTVLYRTELYRTLLNCTVLYCSLLFSTLLYYTLVYSSVLHCLILPRLV